MEREDVWVLCSGAVSSSHSHVNIMGNIGELNNHYPPAKNSRLPVKDYLRECIKEWYGRTGKRAPYLDIIAISSDQDERGLYRFTIYSTKEYANARHAERKRSV